MKFIISSQRLLRNLQAISGALGGNNTMPILYDFLFQLDDRMLTVTSTDLESTMIVKLETDMSEGKGEVAIPAKMLIEILKSFPDIPITFQISLQTFAVELLAGEGKYKLSGHPSDEFPQPPALEKTVKMTFSAELLVNAFEKTVFAVGSDELRPAMSGVLCELTPEYCTFVATDAHKLVRYRRTDAVSEQPAALILPKKPITQLKGILSSNPEAQVFFEYNEKNAAFSFENFRLICRLIDGKFPNYEAVIPAQNPNRLTIDRLSLLSALRRVAIFANKSTHQVRFKITGQELFLSSEDLDFSNEAKERLSCNYEGEDMEIGFNSRFFQEMLANIQQDTIRLEMSAPNRPGILLPVDNENQSEDILMLVMPVMITS
ncbi:MAG TPA: DNA polymerase III subunit beta [Bacteroidales bacterium]|nr:DNA polymerase III subunit beta [Bacteroidales bacterium]